MQDTEKWSDGVSGLHVYQTGSYGSALDKVYLACYQMWIVRWKAWMLYLSKAAPRMKDVKAFQSAGPANTQRPRDLPNGPLLIELACTPSGLRAWFGHQLRTRQRSLFQHVWVDQLQTKPHPEVAQVSPRLWLVLYGSVKAWVTPLPPGHWMHQRCPRPQIPPMHTIKLKRMIKFFVVDF